MRTAGSAGRSDCPGATVVEFRSKRHHPGTQGFDFVLEMIELRPQLVALGFQVAALVLEKGRAADQLGICDLKSPQPGILLPQLEPCPLALRLPLGLTLLPSLDLAARLVELAAQLRGDRLGLHSAQGRNSSKTLTGVAKCRAKCCRSSRR